MTAEVTGKRGSGGAPQPEEAVTMDLFGGSSGEDEVVDLEVKKVPIVGQERRLDDLLSDKTFLAPHLHQVVQGHDNTSTAATNTTTSVAVYTIDMVRSALEHADATSPTTLSTSSSSSSLGGKHNRSASDTNPAMCVAACLSCLMYVLVVQANPLCPRCKAMLPPLAKMTGDDAAVKKPKLDLNCAADETE